MAFEFINKIKYANPFIYEIRGHYYYFGSTICRECSAEEIEAYKELSQEFDFLNELTYEVVPRDCIKFNQYFDKIALISTEEFSERKNDEAMHQIWGLIKHLSKAELNNLLTQHANFKKMLGYSRGKYR